MQEKTPSDTRDPDEHQDPIQRGCNLRLGGGGGGSFVFFRVKMVLALNSSVWSPATSSRKPPGLIKYTLQGRKSGSKSNAEVMEYKAPCPQLC